MSRRASVIVVNYNGGEGAVANLKSLSGRVAELGWELVVVDNCSTDGSPDAMARECPSAGIVCEPENRGYASAVNRGLEEASGDTLVVLNADVVPGPGALERLVEAVEGNSDYAIVGGLLVDAQGRVSENTARMLPRTVDILREGFFIPPRRPPQAGLLEGDAPEGDAAPAHAIVPVEVISGAVMALRRSSLEELGPMDAEYFLYNEDVEWCRRARRKGLGVGVAAGAAFEHEGGASTRPNEGPAFAARVLADFHYYCEGEAVPPHTVRRLWRVRLVFRSWVYGLDALAGVLGRRPGSRRRAAIYRLLAGALRSFTWSTSQGIQNGHPSRLFEFPVGACGPDGGRPRILQLIPNMEYGGAQRLVETLVTSTLADRFDFEILTLTHVGEIGEDLRRRGLPVHLAGLSGWRGLSQWKRAADYAALLDADLVHSHLIPADIASYVGFRGRAVRLSTKHNVDPLFTSAVRLLERAVLRDVEVLAVSDAVAAAKSHLGPAGMLPPVLQSPPSVPVAETIAPFFREGERVRLTAIGRLHAQKRLDIYLDAAAELERRSPGRFVFRVVGEGVKLPELKAQAERLNIAEVVEFRPPVADVAGVLDDTDIVVMVSDYEGLPLTILEMLARGRIPLVRRVPGTDEALPAALEPCYIESASPSAVADKVLEICAETERFIALAREGHDWLARRSDYAAVTGRVYDGLLARGRPRSRTRVLHIITRLIVGGAQENTIASVARVDPGRYESHLWCGPQSGPEGSLLGDARSRGIVVRVLPNMVREISPLKDLAMLVQLTRLLRRDRFDVVHTHCTKAGVLGRVAARLAGVPHITHTHHGWSFHDRMSPLKRRLFISAERALAPWTRPMISVSDKTTDVGLKEHIGRREDYRLIRSGIPLDRFGPDRARGSKVRASLGVADDAFVVGSVGRLAPQKNPIDFLRVASSLLDRHENAVFLYVGDGPMREEVEAAAAGMGVSERVLLLGVRGDVPDLLRTMDVFVLTSLWEGLPRVVLQALATGVPVVAYDTAGIAEAVHEGTNGFLVPHGSVDGMVEHLERLACDPVRRSAMGATARDGLAHEFTEDGMLEKLEALYAELTAEE